MTCPGHTAGGGGQSCPSEQQVVYFPAAQTHCTESQPGAPRRQGRCPRGLRGGRMVPVKGRHKDHPRTATIPVDGRCPTSSALEEAAREVCAPSFLELAPLARGLGQPRGGGEAWSPWTGQARTGAPSTVIPSSPGKRHRMAWFFAVGWENQPTRTHCGACRGCDPPPGTAADSAQQGPPHQSLHWLTLRATIFPISPMLAAFRESLLQAGTL